MRLSTLASMLFSFSFALMMPFTLLEELFTDFAARLDGIGHPLVAYGINVRKGQVFKFAAHASHAEAVGDRCVDLQCLASDLFLALGREVLQRPHVMQAVGKLDKHDADVIDHGENHLADVLGLGLFAGGKINAADLGNAFDDVSDLLAEFRLDLLDGDRGVFDRVVKETGGNGGGVEAHVGEDDADLKRMDEVGLAGSTGLPGVVLLGELVGFLNEFDVVLGRFWRTRFSRSR